MHAGKKAVAGEIIHAVNIELPADELVKEFLGYWSVNMSSAGYELPVELFVQFMRSSAISFVVHAL